MKHIPHVILVVALFLFGYQQNIYGQKKLESQISDSLTAIANSYTYVGRVNLTNFILDINAEKLLVTAPDKMAYMPFRPDNVSRIYKAIRRALPLKYASFTITCQVENKNIEDLIPNFYRIENPDSRKQFTVAQLSSPLVTNLSRPYDITGGLKNRHIALWQSHGKYFDQKQSRWVWQRPRVMTTVEDLYTQSYVLPYLVPMLENAGANVLLPRERDTQIHEIIVDNDTNNESRYYEQSDRKSWQSTVEPGFGNLRKYYLQGENPFTFGTCRVIQAVSDDETSMAVWYPNFPEAGRYAVYVSYKSFENSASDARYTVYHRGIKTEFQVNQNLNGGTWVYLGHFYFDKGRNTDNKVVLLNYSTEDGKVITADAVKFGGGMGNVARSPYDAAFGLAQKGSDSLAITTQPAFEPEISNYPRYTEGARYWLQWAGVPDSVYSRTQGKNDYSDDFQSRGFWVNYLVGGSAVAPGKKGQRVPVDLALAFHTDAGATENDSIIGTLGICSVPNTNGVKVFENGISRYASRDLTDLVLTSIVDDIRKQFAPEWTRRGLWNKSYSESRVPEVPTMLLELLSHQNFADMRYGLDPRFRFTVSRSIYKGVLKYLAAANKTDIVVQPLPVEQFSCRFVEKNKLELHWVAVADSLEPTAKAEQYVLYTKVDDGDFDNGVLVTSNRVTSTIQTGKIYSFKVVAVNKGGQSFPSEVLSAYRAPAEKGLVMIVNGFERVSGPAGLELDSLTAGFYTNTDPGVPYMSDISFVGEQYDFKRASTWVNDDVPGFGASHANFESTEIAGNTFNYPYIHGKAMKAAGYSFVSTSVKSVINGEVELAKYHNVDLILGEQKKTFFGRAQKGPEFKTFPLALQQSIQQYCAAGGNLLVSGAYIGSDLCAGDTAMKEDRAFVENTLKYKFETTQASVKGSVKIISSPFKQFKKADISYFAEPNRVSYAVESPDAIVPVGEESFSICRFSENNTSAGVAYSGKYKTCAFSFPFETIQLEKDRNRLMEYVLQFFGTIK